MLGDISNPIWAVFVFIVLPPIVLWIKRKVRPRKRRYDIVVECPHCGAENGLEHLRNYICSECHGTVVLTKGRGSREPDESWDTYICGECGAENIQPLLQCMQCKTPRGAARERRGVVSRK